MAYTKYSLTPANNNATPPDGAPEGMLPSAVNDTMRDMMAQIRDVGDGIRNGTYTMTAPVITGGSISGVTMTASSVSATSLTDSGNLTFTGTGNRITGDMTNATLSNRVAFQTSTSNTTTILSVIPNGTGTSSAIQFYNNSSDLENASVADFRVVGTTDVRVTSTRNGTGTFLPLTMYTGGSERLRIDTSGNINIATAGARITGDFSNGTQSNRVMFQTSTTNGNTSLTVIPNGTGAIGAFNAFNSSDPNNTSYGQLRASASTIDIICSQIGTGTNLPLTIQTGGSERLRIDTSGNVGIGMTNQTQPLMVKTDTDFVIGLGKTSAGSGARIGAYNSALSAYKNMVVDGETVQLATGGAERMRIDSSGNVGIGTSSPVADLDIGINGNAAGGNILIGGKTNSTTKYSAIGASHYSNTTYPEGYLLIGGLSTSTDNRVFVGGAYSELRAATSVEFYTAANATTSTGTERMRIDSSGNVGIGTSSPTVSGSTATTLYLKGISGNQALLSVASNDAASSVQFWSGNGSTDNPAIAYQKNLRFGSATDAGVGGFTERMRITSGGKLLLGTTTDFGANINTVILSAGGIGMTIQANVNGNWAHEFRNASGTNVGTIVINAGGTAYNTTSDYRLKENIAPMTGALDTVAQLKPVTYNWKADGSAGQGFIAHELQAVVPDCVTGEKDAVELVDIKDEEGNVIGQEEKPIYQGIDTSFLVATLTAAIQEQQAMIEELKAKVLALEAK